MENGSYILASNLMSALRIAISERELVERKANYSTDSCFLAALKENLNYLEKHGSLEVKSS